MHKTKRLNTKRFHPTAYCLGRGDGKGGRILVMKDVKFLPLGFKNMF